MGLRVQGYLTALPTHQSHMYSEYASKMEEVDF